MRHKSIAFLLAVAPMLVFAQAPGALNAPPPSPDAPPSDLQPPPEPPPPPGAPAAQSAPPPVANLPTPPAATPEPVAGAAGQWVYTNQYGWLWIPYAREYTFIPSDAQVFPDQYVYYPAYGWRWVVAPWVYGYGPAPYWGALGPRFFLWYSRPWFRVGGYWGWGGYHGWGQYRGWIGPRAWGPRGWAGAPAYYRTGVGGPHPARVIRPAPTHTAQRERSRGERREHER